MFRFRVPPAAPSAIAGAILAGSAAAPALAAQGGGPGALDLYYERTLMATAGTRCGLFQAAVASALNASAAQARSAALRAGAGEGEIAAVRLRAQTQGQTVSCASPDLATAATRVRTAFDGWAKVAKAVYPGAGGGWTADRAVYSSPSWRLVAVDGDAAFGLAGARGEAAPTAVLKGGASPYAARLVFRDSARSAAAWLPRPGLSPLPPAWTLRTVFAAETDAASPGLVHRTESGAAFRFPAEAADALAALDPRERFEVQFLFSGERIRTATFEVGDFAAGRAFMAAGRR